MVQIKTFHRPDIKPDFPENIQDRFGEGTVRELPKCKSFLLNSRTQGVSGKNEQLTKTPLAGTQGSGANAAASVASA